MFTVHPNDIKDFTGDELVELVRLLLHAEARQAGVPLRGVDVPLQITVADGGQDASVLWTGGAASTDYFPGRDIIFQCKAKDSGDAQWESEVWTKKTQPATVAAKVLNDAVKGALDRGGAYIGITAKPLVSPRPADRVKAIEKGIKRAGGNPAKLQAIHVYDGNRLAKWASTHPAVAVWVKQRKAAIELAGFSTLGQWSKRADIASPPFVDSPERKFALGPREADAIDFSQLAARLADELDAPGAAARIWGASGIGKTRALHHALSTSTGLLGELTTASFIFCDFREVASRLWDVANQIVKEGGAAVLVVDGCPLDDARRLNALARTDDSQLRVITLGADGLDQDEQCVMIRPAQADRSTIGGILKAGLPRAKTDEIDYIAELCDGFPRIAVLAAKSYKRKNILKSVDDVAQQILDAAGSERETVRALECLSLFHSLSPDEDPARFDDIAETFVHMKGELMYENLVIAAGQHLVERSHGAMNAQTRPIANFLALRRLGYLRPSTLIAFLDRAPSQHRDAMLARWRFLARSRTLSEVIHTLLRSRFADAEILDAAAAPYLPAFVHVEPDRMATALFFVIGRMPLDELAEIPVTDELVDALRLLAARQPSFRPAAQMVLRLAAVAEPQGSPPVVSLLRQLFQVALAGTRADDRRRREALTEALDEDDARIRRAGVEALAAMIRTYISRSDDFEQVGAEPYEPEWEPADHATIHGYFTWALERLLGVWRKDPDLRAPIEEHVAGELRNLLMLELLPAIETFVHEVVAASGHWFAATKSIGDWLYFDGPAEPTEFSNAVRALYDATLPADPVELALLHSRFWVSDIHDPDTRYADNPDNPDFEYSARQVQALAPGIARDQGQLARAITAMASEEMNAPHPVAQALAAELTDPLGAFEQAVAALDASGSLDGAGFVGALLSALDRRLADRPDEVGALEAIARKSAALTADPMRIATSLRVTDERLDRVTENVRGGTLTPRQTVVLSYGKGLADISAAALERFVIALVDRDAEGGAWAALEVLSMVTHGEKEHGPEIIDLVKRAMLAPCIADGVAGNASHADYVYDRMIRLLDASGAIDANFARGFAQQIERACRTIGGQHGRPSDALRAALAIVVARAPNELWSVLAGFYEVATRVERERLNLVTSATKLFAYDVSRTGSGALFGTPLPLMLDWAAGDPDGRIAFLLSFFPVLERHGEAWAWHPALEELARVYGASKRFRDALRQRIFPSSWGGSLHAHLAAFSAPLAAWTDDPVLGDWAGTMLDAVTRALEERFYGR